MFGSGRKREIGPAENVLTERNMIRSVPGANGISRPAELGRRRANSGPQAVSPPEFVGQLRSNVLRSASPGLGSNSRTIRRRDRKPFGIGANLTASITGSVSSAHTHAVDEVTLMLPPC
jgi:hypothetical protein